MEGGYSRGRQLDLGVEEGDNLRRLGEGGRVEGEREGRE